MCFPSNFKIVSVISSHPNSRTLVDRRNYRFLETTGLDSTVFLVPFLRVARPFLSNIPCRKLAEGARYSCLLALLTGIDTLTDFIFWICVAKAFPIQLVFIRFFMRAIKHAWIIQMAIWITTIGCVTPAKTWKILHQTWEMNSGKRHLITRKHIVIIFSYYFPVINKSIGCRFFVGLSLSLSIFGFGLFRIVIGYFLVRFLASST